MADKTNRLLIKTPEGIAFSLLLASPVTRMLAWLIDFVCLVVVCGLTGIMLGFLSFLSVDFSRAVTVLAYFVIQIGYGIATEWYWQGQTFGKRLLRLRVMDVQGLRLQPSQVVIRNLLRVVDILPVCYLVGGLTCLISRRGQRLGDLAANTIVIRSPKIDEPNLDQLLAGKFNSLRSYPHLAARLRQRASTLDARVALQALLRREELEPQARVSLFAEIATHFRALVEFPADTVEGITDEQYVRNVVDILFRTQAESRKEKVATGVGVLKA